MMLTSVLYPWLINSADDSDPAFIDTIPPNLVSSESERECSRACSLSPRLRGSGGGVDEGSIYSEIGHDTELLIKPPAGKARRNIYAGERSTCL